MMEQVFKFSMLPTEFLMKAGGGTPILVILVYILTLLVLIVTTLFALIKRRKRLLISLLVVWLICLPFLFYNSFLVILWLAVWGCDLMGGGSSCYL